MTTPTTTPVPSNNPQDLLFNAEQLDRAMNSTAASFVDRFGQARQTYAGAMQEITRGIQVTISDAQLVLGGLGYLPPVAYAANISLTNTRQTVTYNGQTYATNATSLPLITSGTFETAKFRLIQGVTATDLFAVSGGAVLVSFLQSGDGAVLRDMLDKAREIVTPQDFMTAEQKMNVFLRLGTIDVRVAVQKALDTGLPVQAVSGRYLTASGPLIRTGRTIFTGPSDAHFLTDGMFLSVTSTPSNRSDGSYVDGFKLFNITAPWVVIRNPSNWYAAPTVVQSNVSGGYQPTVNDSDIWSTLTTEQKNQSIGPAIEFRGNSENITVSNIGGRFVTIGIYDSQYSRISNLDIKGGKGFVASVYFWNIDNQEGRGNRITDCIIRDASFCGWGFARNFDGFFHGLYVEVCGESGGKFGQEMFGSVDAACVHMTGSQCTTMYSFYDGFDFNTRFSGDISGQTDSQHHISGLTAFGCRQLGVNNRGGGNDTFSDLQMRKCGAGAGQFNGTGKKLSNITVYDCIDTQHAGGNALLILGDAHIYSDITVTNSSRAGYGLYAPGNNTASGIACDGPVFFGNPGSVTSKVSGVIASNFARDDHSWPLAVKQLAANVPALQIYSDTFAFASVSFELYPRRLQLLVPAMRGRGEVVIGSPGNETSYFAVDVPFGGVMREAARFHGGRAAGAPIVVTSCPPNAGQANPTFDMFTSSEHRWIDENSTPKRLMVDVVTSTGQVLYGVVCNLSPTPP